MKLVTVFTPTYNRAYCLQQLYMSLVQQTSTNFCWLVIDDGSSDATKELVQSWVSENKIEINYVFQENQGMHGAHNTAYSLIKTELNVCIDSDDYMPNNAIELIIDTWKNTKDKQNLAGLIGYDVFKNGTPIGKAIPKTIKETTLTDLYTKHQIPGDKKLVLRTEIVKKYPKYPIFKGERFVPLGVLYLMIDQAYKYVCIPAPLCVVEYLPDGSSNTIFKQYKLNPKGFRYARTIELNYIKSFKTRVLKVLHLISSTLFIGDYQFFKNNPQKLLTFFCLPIGVIFHMFIILKIKK